MLKSYLIMANTTNHMLNTNRILKNSGIDTNLVPAPVEYGSVCAIAIKILEKDLSLAKEILRNEKNIKIYEDKQIGLSNLMERLSLNTYEDNKFELSSLFIEILKKIEAGEDLNLKDIVYLLKTENKLEINSLYKAADKLRKEIVGDIVDIRGAIEFTNICTKNCKYCGIRKDSKNLSRYRMSEDEILEIVHELHNLGIQTVILQSGEDAEFWHKDKIISLLKRIKKETKMRITLSIGERSYEEYKSFKEAGADNYLLKIETTNRELFKFLHPDDDFDIRLNCSKQLKELGYLNGSGSMVGLPKQTIEDIANDILFFKEMGINMIGIGPFLPAQGTPFENEKQGDIQLSLKALAITRIVCKRVYLPATTSLVSLDEKAQTKALQAGANTIMLVNTPKKHRENYQLYSNKNMVNMELAIKSIKEAGRQFPKWLSEEKL